MYEPVADPGFDLWGGGWTLLKGDWEGGVDVWSIIHIFIEISLKWMKTSGNLAFGA